MPIISNLSLSNLNNIYKDIETYVKTSQKRGSDTFGLSFKTEKEVETLDDNLELSKEVEFDDNELDEALENDINLQEE